MTQKKRIWLPTIRIFLCVVVFSAIYCMINQHIYGNNTVDYNENGVRHHGVLRVEGTQLVSHSGKAVQLRGMSSHGLQWYPEYTNYRALVTTREYGANLFRAAMYADSTLNGYSQDEESAANNKMMLYSAIENALAADMYVIADWHILVDENPLALINKAIPFFDELSQFYADEPGVIYEICNEPNGSATWEDIKVYADRLIPVIRKNAPDAIILVGTPEHSSALLKTMADPLSYHNVMYVYHYYSDPAGDSFYATLDAAKAHGVPVFISEWGICTDPSTGQIDHKNAKDFIDYIKKNQLSWANWSLSNKAEDYSAIRPEVAKISGWTEEDLTEGGKLVFAALGG